MKTRSSNLAVLRAVIRDSGEKSQLVKNENILHTQIKEFVVEKPKLIHGPNHNGCMKDSFSGLD